MHQLETNIQCDGPDSDKLGKWMRYAETLVKERIILVVEPSSETALIKHLEEFKIMNIVGAGQNHVLTLYDVKQAGESMSRPSLRPPSLRKVPRLTDFAQCTHSPMH